MKLNEDNSKINYKMFHHVDQNVSISQLYSICLQDNNYMGNI